MKIGSVPIAAVTLLLVALIKFIIKHFFTPYFFGVAPYLDGAMMGVLLVYIVYYANIYITAWVKNRKKELTN